MAFLLDFLNDLNNVLVVQDVVFAHFLRLMFNGGPPNQSILELLQYRPMNLVTEVLNAAPEIQSKQDWCHSREYFFALLISLDMILRSQCSKI